MDIRVEPEVAFPIYYQGEKIHNEGFCLDLLVEDSIVVELKSVEKVQPVHKKQVLTYLRLARKPFGLLINFNEVLLKNGISRPNYFFQRSQRTRATERGGREESYDWIQTKIGGSL